MNRILFAARLFFIISTLFTGTVLKAQTFSLVKEINTTATTNSIGSSLIQRVGSTVYFVANDGVSGNELWKSDGTIGATVIVKDINPGAGSTSFANFTAGDGLLFFTANDGTNGFELWRTDGTDAGTFMLRDGFSGCTFCLNRYFFHNGILYFAGDDGTTGAELWKSDGTVAGTVLVKDIYPGPTTSHPAPTSGVNYTFVAVGNDVFFTAVDAVAGRELFKTDGTAAGTVMVKDIYPGATSSISTVNHKAAAFNGKLYFVASDGVSNTELWATDGTESGTYLVKDIVPGGGVSQPNNLIAFNGALYFTASSTHLAIPDLWKTDGTEVGTVLVRNLVADGITLTIGSSSIIDFFTVANGKLFFRGNGPNGLELYASDGTTAGTGIVKDIYPGVNGVNLNSLFAFNNNVYFIGTDVELPSRSVLYKSDGTAAGTVQITDGASGGTLGMGSATMTSAAGKLFFWGNTNDYGIELWSTDGTNANTVLVKDINTIKVGTPNSGANAFGTLVHNGYYYYAAVDDTHGNELWKSDGTEAGTVLVKDIWPGKAPSNPAQFFVYNGAIYFTASNGISGTELWKTDGTEAGTVLVADINPGPVNSGPNRFFISNNYLYFTAYHPSYGIELWRSDGTAAGTTIVIDLLPGAGHGTGSIIDVVSLGSNAYAIMNLAAGNVLGISGSRLLKIDGVANTISDFAPVITSGTDLGSIGNTIFITGRNAANQTLLWKSENGGALSQVKVLSTTVTNAYQLTNCSGKLYFSANNGTAAGQEPWISDGTEAGTFMLKDINPGANPSTPYQFVFSGGKVFFTASSTSTNNSEYELWATDGTTGGTYLVKDILPGSTGSRPNATISAFGNKVLLTANNGTNGYELWQSDGTSAGTFQLQEFNTNGDGMPLTGFAFNFPTDYVYSKLGDKIVFFARSADKGLQLYSGSIASPYKYVNDNSTANDIYTTAVGDNANNGSQSAPYATLTHALSQASEGDTIYVDAGNYAEQVIINKGISIIGAGQFLTFFSPPATTLIPAPGPFTEIGLFETTQGIADVHISNLFINSNNASQNIIIQGGGSVTNCILANGFQGIFFRVESGAKTALIENNSIQPVGIGINCQGSGLTALIRNNRIIGPPNSYYAGIFAGLDFGPLPQLTIQNNIVQNYFGIGLEVNSNNGNYNFNSFGGTNGAKDINRTSGNTPSATCNWFGSTDAGVVASKISGTVNYTPFLTSGTDNSEAIGFQPVNAACSGRNAYYVNDNSLAGDVFTSAIGSNSNNGSASTPFATISYALTQAAPDDYIYVDAGTYTEQVTTDKGITIIGAGQNLTSILKPAVTIAPPGSFMEQGVIQTAQSITGDVHISNLSVTGDLGGLVGGIFTPSVTPIIIQTGGSVRNCNLQNGNQGIFVRIDPGIILNAKTFVVDGNSIDAEYIAVNFAGGIRLTATLTNNNITAFNPGFSSGTWAGMDFGTLNGLTITGNSFSSYVGDGVFINSNNCTISQNSFTGAGQKAINRSGGSTINATCNWYGSADAVVVVPKLSANVNYSPWLTNGTDNDAATGFQPVLNSCNGRQNKFYVNDADITGDVFTTGVGNDANSGIPSAPLATLQEAINRAQNGDEIYVDAGTYIQNVIINKSVTVRGANYGQNPGASLDRGNETTILPSATNLNLTGGSVIRITVSDVTVDGLLIDGNNPNLTSGTLVNGVDVNAATGIFNDDNIVSNLTVKNTIVKNTGTYGIGLFRTFGNQTGPAVSGNLFTQNRVDNIGFRGIVFAYNAFGDITNNYISRCGGSGTWFSQQRVANINNAPSYVTGNTIVNCNLGMQSSSVLTPASQIYYLNNELSNNTTSNFAGISLIGIGNASGFVAANNKISGFTRGVTINASNATVPILINNNSITNFTNFAIEVLSSNPVNATCNWYGSAAVQDFYAKLSLAADLEILPWLTNGTDNDVATGFQPVPDACDGYPTLITLNSSTNVTCNGAANGTINITTTYGKAPFTYTWTKDGDANFVSNDENLTGLAPGTYRLAITDGNGSNIYMIDPQADGPGTITVTITEPLVLTTSAAGTNNICFGQSNGTASVSVEGGTAPYTYLWSNGATTDEITNLIAGTYTVTVTDDNGCTATSSFEVTQPTLLTASISNNSTACSNNAMVTAGDGTAPYSYLWSNGSTSSSITGVIAGIYSVTVTDANGCTATASVTLTVSGAFNPTAAATDVTCFGANNGIITVTNANGTAPFTFSIDGVNFLPGAFPYSFTNLAPGTYTVAARDVNGCTGFVTRTVLQPAQLVVTLTTIQSTCFGLSTGSVSVNASGGTGALSYSWTGDGGYTSSQKNISGLATGNYSLTVTDKNGCPAILNVFVPSLTQITVNSTVNNIACKGELNGSILLNVTGGTGNFTYLWNTGATTSSITNLGTGNYSVTVTDIGSGCVASKSFTITQPSNVVALSIGKTNATGCASLGTITATGSGGTSPYQYSLDGINYQPSGSFTGLYAGSYIVRVKDFNGCIKTSAAISITDNGLDEYDGSGSNRNNTKSKAAPISTGVTIAGRIATTGDPEDWYKFTVTTAGNYILSLTHPSATFAFNLFTLNNATALPTVSLVGVTPKVYSLTAGDYYIRVTGGLSYVCYSLNVSTVAARNSTTTGTANKPPVVIASAILKAYTYPNPHNGNFTLSIESPEEGVATVELYTVNGQKLSERKANVVKGKGNTVNYSNMKYATLFYKVRIGKHVVTGKIISPN